MNYVYRPIIQWPGSLKDPSNRRRAPFGTQWGKTLQELDLELRMLEADNLVFQIAVKESDIRLDGKLRPGVKAAHPGVIISFDSKHGPMSYPCDTFNEVYDNIRAIVVALNALRMVQRYGVGENGEQYRGWKALADHRMSRDAALAFLSQHGDTVQLEGDGKLEAYRRALGRLHPDRNGGDETLFKKLQEAKSVLGI